MKRTMNDQMAEVTSRYPRFAGEPGELFDRTTPSTGTAALPPD